MRNKLPELIYRTRGIYMLIALMTAMVIKLFSKGTTPSSAFVAGLAVAAVAQVFRVYAASYLKGNQAVVRPVADFLCTNGPYAYVKHPLYFGNLLIGVGLSIAIHEWYAYMLFTISYVLVYIIVIPYEERFLEKKFGEAYGKYKNCVRGLVPKLKEYKDGGKITPNYKAGILGEIHVPFFLAAIFMAILFLFVK